MDRAKPPRFDERQRREILSLARNAIGEYLQNRREITPPSFDFFEAPAAAFVTLRKETELRGCIGCTEALLPLGQTIVNCAISAAFRDPRFPELRPDELLQVQLEVSILSAFEKIQDHLSIEIGVQESRTSSGCMALPGNANRSIFRRNFRRRNGADVHR